MSNLWRSLILSVMIFAVGNERAFADPKFRYVAIGDSYTIGTGVKPQQAWPVWLTSSLRSEGIDIELIANLARTGWTSEEIYRHQIPLSMPLKPNFFTVLVGANDVTRGVSQEAFVKRFNSVLDRLQRLLPNPQHIIVLTIPDFSVTPYASKLGDRNELQRKISEFNAIILKEAQARDLKVVDLFKVSQGMGTDSTLVASDGLHPSPREHVIWAKLIFPVAKELLK